MPAHVQDVASESSSFRTDGNNNEATGVSQQQPQQQPQVQTKTFSGDVVISGMSGRLPESDNVAEFREHLVNGEDMVTEDARRWEPGLHGLPGRSGKLKDLSRFDATLFGVHPKQANAMDPQLRLLLEVTYEAIVDAGVSVTSVRGSRTGVFIGCNASEAHDAWSADVDHMTGYEMTGCTLSMFANRLSYFFDFKGPSFALDSGCSSSLLALDQALQAIRAGLCDAAIVGGASLCLRPSTALQFQRLGMLSSDGVCRVFDAAGKGYVRSEAVVAVYLQKSTDAKRVYAKLVHSKSNSDGFKKQGITFPSGEMQKRLLLEVYDEAGVDPSHVPYVELHGTGTQAGDPQEVNSIADVFCPSKGRSTPLLIGSTKSNIGHPEPASGLAAILKVIIAMEDGVIPPNLHYKEPNPDIPGLVDGRLCVVDKPTAWSGGYVGINSFGFGGSNVHVILQSNVSVRGVVAEEGVPRVVTCCGRTEEAVEGVLRGVGERGGSLGMQYLVQESLGTLASSTHPYRGMAVVNSLGGCVVKEIQKCASGAEDRLVWFVFSGMGSQWSGMGRDLMTLDSFRDSIRGSDSLLRPLGVRLLELITESNERTFDDTTNSFVCITAIQVALIDVLRSLGIHPSGMVGHSVGELGCAYADGCLTSAQAVLAAYWRGRCVADSNLPPGGMAAIGMTWEEAARRCPPGIVPACHNSLDTVTVSGPAGLVSKFVTELQGEGVFAREVQSAGVAFHSYCMTSSAPSLHEQLLQVIPEPRPRSPRWISSSVPESEWSSELALTSSAAYHVNNLVSPVLFQEALGHVPPNAVLLEVAPHCLLQGVLRRSLPPDCTSIGLTHSGQQDNLHYFLAALGKLHLAGVNFNPLSLYPLVPLPVPPGTPMLSPLIQWDHSQSWAVPTAGQFPTAGSGSPSVCCFEIDASSPDSEYRYLRDHVVDGRVLFPATGSLVLAWKVLARMSGRKQEEVDVVFENVRIHRPTVLPSTGSVKLDVSVAPVTGQFEVSEWGALVVSGRIHLPPSPLQVPACSQEPVVSKLGQPPRLCRDEVYRELRQRGYYYGKEFQRIISYSETGAAAELEWTSNWVTFLDALLQTQLLALPVRALRLLARVHRLRISTALHGARIEHREDGTRAITVEKNAVLGMCIAGGVELTGLHTIVSPRRLQTQAAPILKHRHFTPYFEFRIVTEIDLDIIQYSKVCQAFVYEKIRRYLEGGADINGFKNCDMMKNLMKNTACDDVTTVDQAVIDKYLTSSNRTVIKLLRDIYQVKHDDGFVEAVKGLIEGSMAALGKDPMYGVIRSERCLKSCLDVVVENCVSHEHPVLKVVEFMAEQGRVFESALPQLRTHPGLQLDYTAAGPHANVLPAELLDELGLQAVVWDVGSKSLPTQLTQADLVVTSDSLHRCVDISHALLALQSMLRAGGFILVIEPITNLLVPWSLFSLVHNLGDVADLQRRSLAPFCSEATWREMFTEAGLQIIAEKSDGVCHTAFLCRKNTTESAVLPKDHLTVSQSKDLVQSVYRDGVWGSFRYFSIDAAARVQTPTAYVNILTRGDLSTLEWFESPFKYFTPSDHPPPLQLCSVYYAALNSRDVMLATGKLSPNAITENLSSQESLLGMEFSGRDQSGNRVMGLLPAKGLATVVAADAHFFWPVPDTWTLEQAASVPMAYATAYYALFVRGRLCSTDSILIHSGSGSIGQASITLALDLGCEVFTTVGSDSKKEYLMEKFPQLTDRSFADSRDMEFGGRILAATGGRGVNVVLNSLEREGKLEESLELLAQHGRFLEIGKFDLANDTSLGMAVFLRNITFDGIQMDTLFEEGNRDWLKVYDLVSAGVKSGEITPLSCTVFDKEEVETAFRCMAQGKHVRKILIKIREDDDIRSSLALPDIPPASVSAIPRTACHSHKSYVIVEGLSILGLELIQWLVDRGCRKLIITSSPKPKSASQSRFIRQWRLRDVMVVVSALDPTVAGNSEKLLKEAVTLGTLGGVFDLSAISLDETWTIQTTDQVVDKIAASVRNLDGATRGMCKGSLDWFVVFSTVIDGREIVPEASCVYAHSAAERICEQRKVDGLPGLAIQWGAIEDVNEKTDATKGGNEGVMGGTVPQSILSCLGALDILLSQSEPVVSCHVIAEASRDKSMGSSDVGLREKVACILGIRNLAAISPSATLGDLGLDSLMGVEVRRTLERDHDLHFCINDIRQLTFHSLHSLSSDQTNARLLGRVCGGGNSP